MANNGGSRSSASGSNSSLILGILIGMVLGLAVAGGVAWHIAKRPNPYNNKEQRDTTPAEPVAPVTAARQPAVSTTPPPAASGVDGRPRFEFYKILTDKEGASTKSGHRPSTAPAKESPKPSAQSGAYFLQAGSFSSAEDADKLKAKLALLGMEAGVQSADVPGKGTYYRVRLGPYHNTNELNAANNTLKQNGINDAAPVRAQ